MRPIIFPYKMASAGAKALAKELGCKRVYPNRKYCPNAHHLIINWGRSKGPTTWEEDYGAWLNPVMSVAAAANKLTAFKIMSEAGVSIPAFTDNYRKVLWDEDTVVRHKLSRHSGEGIEIVEKGNTLPSAPLYVQYIKKSEEYRVHVFEENIIDLQQKRKRKELDNEEVNYQIRSHDNGWVFCRGDVEPNSMVLEEAIKAVEALGLDFGAVDVIWNNYYQKAYVLEVNCAPGLEGQTVDVYAEAIKEYCNNN